MSSYPASLCFKVREHHSCRWLQTEMPGSSSVILFTVWWRGFPPNHYPAVVSTYHTCHRSVPNLDRIHGRSGSRPNPTTVRINSWEAIHNIQLHTHTAALQHLHSADWSVAGTSSSDIWNQSTLVNALA